VPPHAPTVFKRVLSRRARLRGGSTSRILHTPRPWRWASGASARRAPTQCSPPGLRVACAPACCHRRPVAANRNRTPHRTPHAARNRMQSHATLPLPNTKHLHLLYRDATVCAGALLADPRAGGGDAPRRRFVGFFSSSSYTLRAASGAAEDVPWAPYTLATVRGHGRTGGFVPCPRWIENTQRKHKRNPPGHGQRRLRLRPDHAAPPGALRPEAQ
jgi:hypothetical protein